MQWLAVSGGGQDSQLRRGRACSAAAGKRIEWRRSGQVRQGEPGCG
jgi:hypothetical protein